MVNWLPSHRSIIIWQPGSQMLNIDFKSQCGTNFNSTTKSNTTITMHQMCLHRILFHVQLFNFPSLWQTRGWQINSNSGLTVKQRRATSGSDHWWRRPKSMRKDRRRWEYMTGLSVCIFLPLPFSSPSLPAWRSVQLSGPADKQVWLLDITPIWGTQS